MPALQSSVFSQSSVVLQSGGNFKVFFLPYLIPRELHCLFCQHIHNVEERYWTVGFKL